RNVGDEDVVDAVDGAQRAFDLARVDGGTADFEHVVRSAVVEQEPVFVEMTEVAGGVEAVGREDLFPAASADATQRVGPPNLYHANASRRREFIVGADDANFHAWERFAAATPRRARHVRVGRI